MNKRQSIRIRVHCPFKISTGSIQSVYNSFYISCDLQFWGTRRRGRRRRRMMSKGQERGRRRMGRVRRRRERRRKIKRKGR